MREKYSRLTGTPLVLIMALSLTLDRADAQHQPGEHGAVEFSISCDESVQQDFNHGVAMLHNMMYEMARGSFEAIAEADPDCAMAYWGIATTLFQPLWASRPSADELQYGWENASKAIELAETEREQLLAASTGEFFREPDTAEYRTRIQRWADAMTRTYLAYPDDLDIAALYGLTRLTLAQYEEEAERELLYDEAESLLRGVYEESPAHPGAIHYSIHATDVDGRSGHALDMVQAYGEIAPFVPHALHMPSHIYVRLGDWSQVIDWNLRSADSALEHPVGEAESHHFIHAIDYLVYAYLQRGEDDKAVEAYNRVLERPSHQPTFISTFHFAAIPARLAVERRDWEAASALEIRTPDYLPWDEAQWAEGLTWFTRGLGAVHTGDLETARTALQHLEELRDNATERGDNNIAVYIETDRLMLSGRVAHAEGDGETAVELMQQAADLEGTVEKHPVTPGALQPPNEALGDLFMELGRPEEALSAYEAYDQIWPGRMHTLLGAALAARMSGNEQSVRMYAAKLANQTETSVMGLTRETQEPIEH